MKMNPPVYLGKAASPSVGGSAGCAYFDSSLRSLYVLMLFVPFRPT